MKSEKDYEFDVTLSFAGEDRTIVEEVAKLLEERGVKVFYDRNQEANLWGKNLVDKLSDVYGDKARYCIIFVSEAYVKKHWTKLERQHAQARAFTQEDEYILPVRLDDTMLPGMAETIGYIDARDRTLMEIADLFAEKLGIRSLSESPPENEESEDFHLPKVRREFSNLDRMKVVKETFIHIANYFERGIVQLEKHDKEIETEFEQISDTKFVATVFLRGQVKNAMKVWTGGFGGDSNQICYSQGHSINISSDSSMNGWATIKHDDYELKMELNNSMISCSGKLPDDLTGKENIAKALWIVFTDPLSY